MNIKKPDYKDSLVNLACSILKYMNISYTHNTMSYIDNILDENNYKNVVVMLYDGMGTKFLEKTLGNNSFLLTHKKRDFSSVFPATTTAATTSILTGLEPVEHCWLGWDMYISDEDETVTLYLNTIKDTAIPSTKKVREHKDLDFVDIVQRINKESTNKAYYAWPFDNEYPCNTLEEVHKRIKTLCKDSGKKYIYAYYPDPDKTMHQTGTYSKETIDEIKFIDEKTKELCEDLENTLVIIVADHGHVENKYETLSNYPTLFNMIKRTISIEMRACSIYLKDEVDRNEFEKEFKNTFKDKFILLTKEQVIKEKLFGQGKLHPRFDSCIGDYMAISNKDVCIRYDESGPIFKSVHGGMSTDEMIIPLIIIEKK